MFGGASTGSEKVDQVFLYITALTVGFLVFITALMLYFVIRYRQRPGVIAKDIEGHTALEIAWTLIPLGLFLSMFYYGWTNYKYLREVPRDAMVIRVTARQWAWSFTYPDGRQTTELNVALGRPVKLELESLDVVHGFYIPAFRVKQDVVPGAKNYTWFQATQLGSFDIECTVICGVDHSYMLSKVHVLPEEDFRRWYAAAPGEAVARQTVDAGVKIAAAAPDPHQGEERFRLKGCVACHTVDGGRLVGPSLKGVYGQRITVVSQGQDREIVADDDYLARSIRDPMAEITKGFRPEMTKLEVSEHDVASIIAYLKTLR